METKIKAERERSKKERGTRIPLNSVMSPKLLPVMRVDIKWFAGAHGPALCTWPSVTLSPQFQR